jgi:cardiolipin synthase C
MPRGLAASEPVPNSAAKRTPVSPPDPNRTGSALAWRIAVALLVFHLSSAVARTDKVRIIENPEEAAQLRIDLIQQARKSIDAQYYIVGKDYFTLAGLSLLRDATRRGCQVRLIIDGVNNKVPKTVQAELAREHIGVKLYHSITLKTLHLIFHRMHDKGLNIDGKCMIRGGRNAEGDYFGYWKHNFVDRDVYVEGRAVAESVAYFDHLWNSNEVAPVHVSDPTGALADEGRKMLDAAHDRLRREKPLRLNTQTDWSSKSHAVSRVDFLHDPVGKKNIEFGIAQALRQDLLRTRKSVLIETPYLVPTDKFLTDVTDLRRKGVKFEIITNSAATNDDLFVEIEYEKSKKKLLELGVDLWEFRGGNTLHAKSAVLDNQIALIGSFNMDPRSQQLNTETGVAIHDEATARQLRQNIERHKAGCFHVTADHLVAENDLPHRSLFRRIEIPILNLILPLLHGHV